MDVVVQVREETWRGRRRRLLKLVDARPAGVRGAHAPPSEPVDAASAAGAP